MIILNYPEYFSVECGEAQTKAITTQQAIIGRKMSQRELKVQTSKLPEARENVGEQVAIDFSFECDWLRKRREFSGPITKRLIRTKIK